MHNNTPRFVGHSISLAADHVALLRQFAAEDRRKSLSEMVQVLIEQEAERRLKE